jgi:hypothetical protein
MREAKVADRKLNREERHHIMRQQNVLLGLTVFLALITAYCAIRGLHTVIPATGGSSLAAGIGSIIGRRHKPK